MDWLAAFKANLLEVLCNPGQPRDELGRCASTGGSSILAKGGEAKVVAVESEIANSKVEVGVVFDYHGNEILRKTGTENMIVFTPEDVASMRGQVFTHNHPSGAAQFSKPDVLAAESARLMELRVVTDDYLCTLRPPGGSTDGWSKSGLYTSKVGITQTFGAHIEQISSQVSDEFRAAVLEDRMSIEDANADYGHAVWTMFADQLGFAYSRTPRGK